MQSKRVLTTHRGKEEREGEDDVQLGSRRATAHGVRVGAPRRIQMLSSDRSTRRRQMGMRSTQKAHNGSSRSSITNLGEARREVLSSNLRKLISRHGREVIVLSTANCTLKTELGKDCQISKKRRSRNAKR